MGFERKQYVLQWPEESIWHGLEVRLRGMTFDQLQLIAAARGENVSDAETIKPLIDILGQGLISWNLTDESGAPVPIDGFADEDASMLLAIVTAWTQLVGDIPAPLDSGSPTGKQSEEALMPMEVPSSSHPNSNTPS